MHSNGFGYGGRCYIHELDFERYMNASDTNKLQFQTIIEDIVRTWAQILSYADSYRGKPGVIKISSATLSGAVSAEKIHTKSTFLLSGKGYESSAGGMLRRSSFATAYAAGLAALVLYTMKAYTLLRDDVNTDDAGKALTIASKGDEMQTIFRVLA